jgi:hypothetical protein
LSGYSRLTYETAVGPAWTWARNRAPVPPSPKSVGSAAVGMSAAVLLSAVAARSSESSSSSGIAIATRPPAALIRSTTALSSSRMLVIMYRPRGSRSGSPGTGKYCRSMWSRSNAATQSKNSGQPPAVPLRSIVVTDSANFSSSW